MGQYMAYEECRRIAAPAIAESLRRQDTIAVCLNEAGSVADFVRYLSMHGPVQRVERPVGMQVSGEDAQGHPTWSLHVQQTPILSPTL